MSTRYLLKFTREDGTLFYIGPKSAFEKASTTKSAKVKGRSAKTAKGTSTKMTDAAADASHSQKKKTKASAVPGCIAYKKMFDCYRSEYQPPLWTVGKCADLLEMYGNSAVALYPRGANLADVKRLVSMREPTNIANPNPKYKQYDAGALEDAFDYREGVYRELSQNGTVLPPQVAVACTTPIVAKPAKVRMSPDMGEHKVVNVVSIIGLVVI